MIATWAPFAAAFLGMLYQLVAVQPVGVRNALKTRKISLGDKRGSATIGQIEMVTEDSLYKNKAYLQSFYNDAFLMTIITKFIVPILVVITLFATLLEYEPLYFIAPIVLFSLMAIHLKSSVNEILKMN